MPVYWQFNPMDSWFFRDSKPMNAGESSWLESQFPPTGQTLQGAIRTSILDKEGVNYTDLANNEQLTKAIGNANHLGELQLTGPWIQKNNTIYYPIPLNFVKNKIEQRNGLLTPSKDPLDTDMGKVKMPAIQGSGYKTLENYFVSYQGMEKLLKGDSNITDQELIPCVGSGGNNALADREPKVGLARDNQTRTTIESMLFAIAPIRPRENVRLICQVSGCDNYLPTEAFLQPLGGEGKLAHVTQQENFSHPDPQIIPENGKIRFKMVLTTHASLPENGWLPEGFTENTALGYKTWQGEIEDIPVHIITACIGKPFRQGGWNHAEKKAKPLRSYVPAGSVYFCETDSQYKQSLIEKIHNKKIGKQTEYGFGHVLLGQWSTGE